MKTQFNIPNNPSHAYMQGIGFAVSTGAVIVEGGDEQGYSTKQDVVVVRDRERYPNELEFLISIFHELGHWVAGPPRLGTFDESSVVNVRGENVVPPNEEIIAETVAMMVMKLLGLMTDEVEENAVAFIHQRCVDISMNEPVPLGEDGVDGVQLNQWLRERFADEVVRRYTHLVEIAKEGRSRVIAEAVLRGSLSVPSLIDDKEGGALN